MTAVRFYKVRNQKWGPFSNFSRHPIFIDGTTYPTAEHYYQSQKFVTTDPTYAKAISRVTYAGDAAKMGRDPSRPLRGDWEDIKVDVMRKALRAKMIQHRDVLDLLVESGEREIIENSPNDYFWGCGAENTGENVLGRLWMELREEVLDLLEEGIDI